MALDIGNSDMSLYLNSAGGTSAQIREYSMSVAGDISTAVYSGKQLDASSQVSSAVGLRCKPDGAAVYILGAAGVAYQYTLGTPWDLSTGSYASKSLSVAAQEAQPKSLAFSADGSKMYVVGINNDTVYQYTLGTPWDLSTGSYASLSKSISAQTTGADGLYVKPDGSKMFLVFDGGEVYEYALGTAGNVSTAVYSSISVDTSTQGTTFRDITFDSTGFNFYMPDTFTGKIYQYSL